MKHPHRSLETQLAQMQRVVDSMPPRCTVCRGPTLEQFVAAGYPAERYPPQGYAATTIPCCRRDD